MSDLGQLLKKARLEKGISMEQLEEMTKIRKRYLEAIEEGDYKILPGSFYVRAFIKSYSETVGLEPNEVLAMYGNSIPTLTTEDHIEPTRRRKRDARTTEKLSKWATNILMLAFILLILGTIYYFIGDSYDAGDSKQVDPGNKLHQNLPEEMGLQSGMKSDAPGTDSKPNSGITPQQGQTTVLPPPVPVVTLVRTENNVDYYTVTNADALNVKLQIIGDECWLRIDKIVFSADNRRQERQAIEEKLYKKGDTRDWTSDSSVYMTIGFPPAAEVVVNGMKISVGDKKDVKRIQIDLQKG